MSFKKRFLQNGPFLLPHLGFLLLSAFFLLQYSKIDIHLSINQYHSSLFDVFFKYATYLGDGLWVTFAVLLLLFVKYRFSLYLFYAAISTLLVIGLLKNIVFDDVMRPGAHLLGHEQFHTVPGVKLHKQHSFPSGHTAAAFCLYFFLATLTRKKWLKGLLFLVALIVAYSRMYLSQHFLIDVVFGSLIGVSIASFFSYLMARSQSTFLAKSILKR